MECNCDWIKILSALLTPTIAIIGVIIAALQWQVNDLKRKNDLFDRRYSFYQRLEKAWLSTEDKNNRTWDFEDLCPIASEAEMLFGKDIAKHIITLADKRHKGSQFFPNDDFSKPFMKYLRLK